MKAIKAFMVTILACFIAVQSNAQGDPGANSWYATVDVGLSRIDYDKSDVNGFVRLDDDATAWGISAGYYALPWLAVETGYFDHGSFSGSGFHCPTPAICVAGIFPVRGELDSLSINLIPVWSVNGRISLNGKLGVSRWDLSTTLPSPESSGTDFQYGGAVRVHLSTQLDLQARFEISGDRESFLAGLRWNF